MNTLVLYCHRAIKNCEILTIAAVLFCNNGSGDVTPPDPFTGSVTVFAQVLKRGHVILIVN